MKTIFLLIVVLSCFSCQQKNKEKINIDPMAKKLNDSAVDLAMANQQDKAIAVLDEAIKIDSNYFPAYFNKLNFLASAKPFDKNKVLYLLQKLRSLKPADPLYPMKIGMIYVVNGDSANAVPYFSESVTKFDRILDTMSVSNNGYDMCRINKAAALVLLGNEKDGQGLMTHVYETTKQEPIKNFLEKEIHKSRKEMIDDMSFYK